MMSDAAGPPPRTGPRDPGDAWVVADDGSRYWGVFGAAGLLAVDAERGILLQHRVGWSHFGGTWALPGGARHAGEDAVPAALREAAEEAGVPADGVVTRLTSVLDLGAWSYTTVVADVVVPFDPVISDPESMALEWVPVDEVADRALHPGFAASWPALRAALDARPVVVVDVANVVGSVPDGWWRDRAGAASRLLGRLSAWTSGGVDARALDLPATRWMPSVIAVVEGAARDASSVAGVEDSGGARVTVVPASGSGDDAIVAEVDRLSGSRHPLVVVTSDRGLADRVAALGARVHGARWLLDQLPG